MSNAISLTATKRDTLGTNASRRLRAQGIIPAVIYSCGAENVNFQLSLDQVLKIEHHAGLVSLDIQGVGVKNAIVKAVQYKAINDAPLSVDFLEVKAGEKVSVVIPVEPKGEPEGLRAGGQLEQVIHELEIEVSPAEIPEVLMVDVSALQLDQELTVADVKLPGDAKALGDLSQIVFQVRMPHTKMEEPEAAAPAEGEAAPAPEKK
ncbi:MAG: 50S ribosomal protein L25 [Oligosphaeraceae bacterium]